METVLHGDFARDGARHEHAAALPVPLDAEKAGR